MSRVTSVCEWVLRQPVLWGGMACLLFYFLLRQGFIENETIIRYADNHGVKYATIALFFVGLAALLMRLLSLSVQFSVFNRELLPAIPAGGQNVDEAPGLLNSLTILPEVFQQSYLVARLRDALQYVRRKNSADDLEKHLRHLEEADAVKMSSGYSMVRIIVWAIPILGFLGTVIGITMAIANLSPEALEDSLNTVTSKLGLAFDTTALALGLSIVLMFVKFCVERVEYQLLVRVDKRAAEELVGRFHEFTLGSDPNVSVIRKMSEQVVQSVEGLAAKQAQIWKSSIDETHEQWAQVTSTAGEVLGSSLSTALKENYELHAEALNEGAERHAQMLNDGAMQHTARVQAATDRCAEAIASTTNQHASQLNEGATRLTQELSESSQETVAGLREGLEKLAELLVEALEKHGESLTRSEEELARENRRHLSEVEAALGESMVVSAERQEALIRQSEQLLAEMKQALGESTDATIQQQQQLIRQSTILNKVVEATGQIKELEDALNQNLGSLSRAHGFEETLLSLSSAVQLLSSRLRHESQSSDSVSLQLDESRQDAA